MSEYTIPAETEDANALINSKLRQTFDGRIVRKDLTKKIKEGANVPVYVLEFLLGQYCSSDDPDVIEAGVNNVKRILAENYVRPDEAQKILSVLRQRGSYTVIDKITVNLNIKKDSYEAEFSNLGVKNIPISEAYPTKFDRLLCGGIWCIVQLEYEYIEEEKNVSPIRIHKLTPIQMPHVDIEELKQGRKAFTQTEWMTILLRSIGMEPDKLSDRAKWLLIARMIPLVENNFNMCELGPRSTGKSYIYEQISPNSILVAGGQTTVANLFYNMSNNTVGLVGMWDVVAFDEVAGIKFKDKDGIQIMKGYMASGAFSRGKAEIQAKASMVFVGNINQSVETLQKTSSLFDPFPPEMGTDTAFLDRFHAYIPGWEIPKYRPDSFTNDYGFITDYLSEFMRELRKDNYSNIAEKYFKLGNNLNQRDAIAVRKLISGFIKLIYPDGEVSKEEVAEIKDGVVKIVSIAREEGSRTKISVKAEVPNVDPVGACVGINGARVKAIVNELGNEQIDIIEWDENPAQYIVNALSPAKVVSISACDDENGKKATVVVSDQQLSLAIGKAGQNVRLAAKLTGYGIDIKSESQIEDSAKPESDDETDIDDDMLVFSEDTDTQAETDADEVNE